MLLILCLLQEVNNCSQPKCGKFYHTQCLLTCPTILKPTVRIFITVNSSSILLLMTHRLMITHISFIHSSINLCVFM